MATLTTISPVPKSAAHFWFEKHQPELTRRSRSFVRRLPCGEREEAVAEVLANSFRYALNAERRGKLDRLTPATLVGFFGRSYRSGRRLAGSKSTDVLSAAGRRRHHLRIVSLDDPSAEAYSGYPSAPRLSDVLADPKADRPPENARRNGDYADILDCEAASPKVRRVFTYLCETAGAGRQIDLARELGVSAPRICQLKAELAEMLAAHGYEPLTTRPPEKPAKKRGRPAKGSRSQPKEIPLNAGTSPAPKQPSHRKKRQTLRRPARRPLPELLRMIS